MGIEVAIARTSPSLAGRARNNNERLHGPRTITASGGELPEAVS